MGADKEKNNIIEKGNLSKEESKDVSSHERYAYIDKD